MQPIDVQFSDRLPAIVTVYELRGFAAGCLQAEGEGITTKPYRHSDAIRMVRRWISEIRESDHDDHRHARNASSASVLRIGTGKFAVIFEEPTS